MKHPILCIIVAVFNYKIDSKSADYKDCLQSSCYTIVLG